MCLTESDVLTDASIRADEIRSRSWQSAAYPEQAGGDAAGAAHRAGRAALRAAARRSARSPTCSTCSPAEVSRHDDVSTGSSAKTKRTGSARRACGSAAAWRACCAAARNCWRTCARSCGVQPRRHDARTARSRWSSPSASARAKGRRRAGERRHVTCDDRDCAKLIDVRS